VTVKVEVDSNKDTQEKTFDLRDYDSIEEMLEAVQEYLERWTD